jgi:N-acetylmuramoyl-L-alanine amidase
MAFMTDELFDRVVRRKHDMANQHIVNRLNRRAENKRIEEIEKDYTPLALIVYGMILAILAMVYIDEAHAADIGIEIDISCLALNIYHEAGNEPDKGKIAVAFTTLNRVRDKQSNVCEEVFRRKQFSWANNALDTNGKLKPEYIPRGRTWVGSRRIARMVMSAELTDFTGGATHYHATYISTPRWAGNMRYLGQWGTHLFYTTSRR